MGISFSSITSVCRSKKHKTQPRDVIIGRRDLNTTWYPRNAVKNHRYNFITFIPLVLYDQFKFFLNLYFLVMACTQFIPILRIGSLSTYWTPLILVVTVSMLRVGYDDIKRALRDKKLNSETYTIITKDGERKAIKSIDIEVSDVIIIQKNQRVPADVVLLQTSDKSGSCFIRTDQLDGETDWKLRVAVPMTQSIENISDLMSNPYKSAKIHAEPPSMNIQEFTSVISWKEDEALNIENILWSGTFLSTNDVICCVIYTGSDTRMAMNTNKARSKVGLVDLEINNLTKLLFVALFFLATIMMILKGFTGKWFISYVRFFLVFSYMIPISLLVNLDLSKIVYSLFIHFDKAIPGTIVRSSTICEELGRIGYLLTDKTGTLTQNVMLFKRISFGSDSYTIDNQDELTKMLNEQFPQQNKKSASQQASSSGRRRSSSVRGLSDANQIVEAIKAIALCHNVTPVYDEETSIESHDDQLSTSTTALLTVASSINTVEPTDSIELTPKRNVTYQASSPDEIALVEWTEKIGLTLIYRDSHTIRLKLNSTQEIYNYEILQLFPFTATTKRMGIIIRDQQTNEILFYMKGADIVMQNIINSNDWLLEECSNMGREGLRTLVVAKKVLTEEYYKNFEQSLTKARLQILNRVRHIQETIETIENDMQLLCITGVEDKLQDNVRQTLETLRTAGIKIWMLTGDKLETAICIGKSSKLIGRNHDIFTFNEVRSREECLQEINLFRRKTNACIIINGDILQIYLAFCEKDFMEISIDSPAVVVCRCSPTQKASVVDLLKEYGNKKVRVGAIGDGGNDVSMIQRADVGIGIVGKEGQQASAAADFSVTQFSYLSRLLLVHGRNDYKRAAKLSQFIFHRGLTITVMEAIFSSILYYASVSLYPSVLLLGYGTIYTMCPVFALVLDKDVPDDVALMYPELYRELAKGRSLSYKTFFLWGFISIYQGAAIMYGALLLFDEEFLHIVLITFTALILTELLMIVLTIRTWHILMVVAEVISFGVYFLSLYIFRDYFDPVFLASFGFVARVILVTLISCIPLYILKFIQMKFYPPIQEKLAQSSSK